MTYLAVTQPTAEWLLGKKEWLRALHLDLPDIAEASNLRTAVLAAGPLRAASSDDERILGVWNPDYLSNTGGEPWGFIRLTGPLGLITQGAGEEVLERALYVINQRLQGLLLDERLIHKSEGDIHTCLSGRGEAARQQSLAYVENELNLASGKYRGLVCVGPDRDLARVRSAAAKEVGALPALTAAANAVIARAVLRPPLESVPTNLAALLKVANRSEDRPIADVPHMTGAEIGARKAYETIEWTYDDWIAPSSSLTQEQRRILESDVLLQQPVRLIGAAGAGKTLLMQLLAIRRLRAAPTGSTGSRILYVVHNTAMMHNLFGRFITLGASEYLDSGPASEPSLEIRTLFDYSRSHLGVEGTDVIDPDAQATKAFQQEIAAQAISEVFEKRRATLSDRNEAPLLSAVAENEALRRIFAEVAVAEIGVAIKGHGLQSDRGRYVGSERALSRLHWALRPQERDLFFDIFEVYHREVFERFEVLDTDDLAVSLLGQMRTPIWEMKRRKSGYDFVFVDETQLFNENERRIFPLLTRGDRTYVPVALALDQAQDVRGTLSAGLGLLGIKAIADEKLTSIQRSTASILRLAFSVIQRTTDLFGTDFPDFTKTAASLVPENHPFAAPPKLVVPSDENASLGKFVLKQVRALRKQELRHVAVIVHPEEYWNEIHSRLVSANLPLQVLTTRGERIESAKSVVLTHPGSVGGQEFDAVVVVGLEQGRVPPRVQGNEALAAALEQRALREIYVSFTRARYRLVIVNAARSAPTTLLSDAIGANVLSTAAESE
jgi:hypothetical protein